MAKDRGDKRLDELEFHAWRAFLYAYAAVVPTLDRELALLRKATKVHLQGVREHFLNHLSPTELEHLASALEAILDGEGSPLPPLSVS